MDQLKYWLRWLAVLPGALLGSVLLTFLLHWILDNTLVNFIAPYPELPERILSPLVIAAGVVWLGPRIAPARKIETAAVLLGLLMVPLSGHLFWTVNGEALAPLMAFIGGVIGFLVARNEARDRVKQDMSDKGRPTRSI